MISILLFMAAFTKLNVVSRVIHVVVCVSILFLFLAA